jgi:hypothetical protein
MIYMVIMLTAFLGGDAYCIAEVVNGNEVGIVGIVVCTLCIIMTLVTIFRLRET